MSESAVPHVDTRISRITRTSTDCGQVGYGERIWWGEGSDTKGNFLTDYPSSIDKIVGIAFPYLNKIEGWHCLIVIADDA
jgi:hypothetical protein